MSLIKTTIEKTYADKGYETRAQYLQGLSEDFDIDLEIVLALADALGESEDFDGLPLVLDDALKGGVV